MTDRQLWKQALAELRMQMTRTTWERGFDRSTARYRKEGDVLQINVPFQHLDWLTCKWAKPVKRLVSGILGREINIEFRHVTSMTEYQKRYPQGKLAGGSDNG